MPYLVNKPCAGPDFDKDMVFIDNLAAALQKESEAAEAKRPSMKLKKDYSSSAVI
jgi:hypothetical protein